MFRTSLVAAMLLSLGCEARPSDSDAAASDGDTTAAAAARASFSMMEGPFEYVGSLKGQSIMSGGRFVFLYGPSDDSGPLTGEAGTYEIARDTATHRITYSTNPDRIGLTFRWTPSAWAGDTLSYVVMDAATIVTGHGQSVRRR